jgi:hypothetical protein
VFDPGTRRALSEVLSGALLAGAWTEDAIVRRGREALEGPVPWLRPLVRDVAAAYLRPPADRRRELAAYVELVLEDMEAPDPPARPRVRRLHLPVPEMGRTRWTVPELPTLAALAEHLGLTVDELEWMADVRGWARTAPAGALRHYRYRRLERRGAAGPRLLEVPKARLKAVQRTILRQILDRIPAHDAAHGFTAGRSARTNARMHAGRALVICFDLEDFFASVAAGRVYGIFRTAGYPEAVAHRLTGLTTTVTAREVAAQAPDPLRRRLAAPHLPQGAPTSPALANLAAFGLDRRLGGLATATGATYTRYADDLAFSGGPELHRASERLRRTAAAIVRDEGFRLNGAKTRYMTAAGRQRVTGAVVNRHPNVARSDYDTLKALLHDAAVHGPQAANRAGVPDLRAHVAGRISWVAALNPARGARLKRRFDAVDWGGGS